MVNLSQIHFIRARGPGSYWKRKFVFDQTQHFFGRRRNCYSISIRALQKSWQKAFIGRKVKKRSLRNLWIMRINSAAKEYGIKYNPFIGSLLQYNIQLDRKIISNLAITEPKTFKCLAELAKLKHEEGLLASFKANPHKVLMRQATQEDLLAAAKKLSISAAESS